MTTHLLHLDCPCCHMTDALTCRVVRPGPALWVTLVHQACACRPGAIYQAWDQVWWDALAKLAQETPSTHGREE